MEEKSYWWAKLPETFFTNNEVELIWGEPDGDALCAIYLRLFLMSIKHEGRLRYSQERGYTLDQLARLIHKPLKRVEKAYQLFNFAGFWHMEDDGTLVFDRAGEMIGRETDAAKRMRKSRQKDEVLRGKQELERNNVTTSLQLRYGKSVTGVTDGEHCSTLPTPIRKSRKSLRDLDSLSSCSSSKESSQAKDNDEHDDLIERIERFYDAYPKKSGSAPVEEWFINNDMSPAEFEGLMICLNRSRQMRSWNREGGRFVPKPERWLEKRCWTDEDVALGAESIRQAELSKEMSAGPKVSVDVSKLAPVAKTMKEAGK